MRIAYLINQYPKVSHSFIRREILALENQGVAIDRFALRGWDSAVVDSADVLERERTRYVLNQGIRALSLALLKQCIGHPVRFSRALWMSWTLSRRADRSWPVHLAYLVEACWLRSAFQAAQTTHVHAHFGTNSPAVAMLVQALGGPGFSFTVHGPEEFDKPIALHLADKIEAARFVVAISSYGRSQLYRWSPHRVWGKIHTVHCGLEAQYFAAQPVADTVSNRLVCVGRLCEQKGQMLLLEAASLLHGRGQQFELVLAGDGEMRADLEARVRELKLDGWVRITGWIASETVRQELLEARALVLPSFAEGLPVVIMEAMALGRPVISTYVAGIPELVVPGHTGWLVAPGDLQALADTMSACLAADVGTLDRMGSQARERVHSRHDIDVEVAKLRRLFEAQGQAVVSAGA